MPIGGASSSFCTGPFKLVREQILDEVINIMIGEEFMLPTSRSDMPNITNNGPIVCMLVQLLLF